MCQTLHNYLPSEIHKLQFLSGKILEIFYDEFIKFVPPYILKREQEKQKKHIESSMSQNQKIKMQRQSTGEVTNTKLQRKTTQTYTSNNFMPVGIQGIRAMAKPSIE